MYGRGSCKLESQDVVWLKDEESTEVQGCRISAFLALFASDVVVGGGARVFVRGVIYVVGTLAGQCAVCLSVTLR